MNKAIKAGNARYGGAEIRVVGSRSRSARLCLYLPTVNSSLIELRAARSERQAHRFTASLDREVLCCLLLQYLLQSCSLGGRRGYKAVRVGGGG